MYEKENKKCAETNGYNTLIRVFC